MAVVPNVLMTEVLKLKLMVKNGRIASFDQNLTKSEFIGILPGIFQDTLVTQGNIWDLYITLGSHLHVTNL